MIGLGVKLPEVVKGVLAGFAVAAIVFALVWVLGGRTTAAHTEAATAKVETHAAEATAAAGKDALKVTVEVNEHRSAIEATTRSNATEIHAAPGSADTINPAVATAGRAALCRRDAYKDLQICAVR